MNKITRTLLLLLLATASLSSCKKEEPNFNVAPKSLIIFDDNIDKVTADFKIADNVTLKVSVAGSVSTIRIASTYNDVRVAGVTTPKRFDLAPVSVSNGVATINIPTSALRAPGDGPVIGVRPAPAPPLPMGVSADSYTRAGNTYTLIIDAVAADGSSERRFFTVVITA